MDEAAKLEVQLVQDIAKILGQATEEDLIYRRDATIRRVTAKTVIRTPREIRERLQSMLLTCIEVQAEHCENERWRTGAEGAALEGRIITIQGILDWLLGLRCSECGGEIAEGANFCTECGAPNVAAIKMERVD